MPLTGSKKYGLEGDAIVLRVAELRNINLLDQNDVQAQNGRSFLPGLLHLQQFSRSGRMKTRSIRHQPGK